jgi:uncharacterized membrane protein
VFGLALSIGVLALIGKSATTSAELTNHILGFLFSFVILINVWIRYSRIISVLPVEEWKELLLNVILLFLVSIEPYLLSLLTGDETALKEYASVLYALDLAGLMMILALFTHALASEGRGLVKRELISQEKSARNLLFVSVALFLISLAPVFWVWTYYGEPIRYYMWIAPLVLGWVSRIWAILKR